MVLVCRSPVLDEKRPKFKHPKTPESGPTLQRAKDTINLWWKRFTHALPPLDPPRDDDYGVRWLISLSTTTGALVVLAYIILSETQIKRNTVLDGEGQIWTFSQVSVPLPLKITSSDWLHCFRPPLSFLLSRPSGPSSLLGSGKSRTTTTTILCSPVGAVKARPHPWRWKTRWPVHQLLRQLTHWRNNSSSLHRLQIVEPRALAPPRYWKFLSSQRKTCREPRLNIMKRRRSGIARQALARIAFPCCPGRKVVSFDIQLALCSQFLLTLLQLHPSSRFSSYFIYCFRNA